MGPALQAFVEQLPSPLLPVSNQACSRVATDSTTLVNAPAATQSSRHHMPLPYRPARSEPLNSQGSKVLYPGHPVKASLQVGGGAPLGEGMISVRARGAPSLPLRFSLGQGGTRMSGGLCVLSGVRDARRCGHTTLW